jgi:hypothetical protein
VDETYPRRARRWLAAALKLLIVALVLWYIHRTIADAWKQLGEHRWRFDARWLALSGGLYLLATLLCGIFWHRALRALGQPVGLGQTLRAYYLGHLGKYVPGKAMVVILRAGLLRGEGVDTSLVAASVFFETLTMMSTGALMAAAIVAVWLHQQTLLFWAAVAMMAAAGPPTFPPVFRRLVRLAGMGKVSPAAKEKLANLGFGTMFVGWALTGLGWAILAVGYWAALRSVGAGNANPFEQLHLYTAAVTLSTVAGFVSFVPGGAVIREAVLTEVMAPCLGGSLALVSAVLTRLAYLVSELVISSILYFAPRR